MIKDPDLEANKVRMYSPYDVNFPIETLFDHIEEGVEYAAAGCSDFTNEQVVSMAYMTVLKTGMFPDETKEWRKLVRNLKTWDEFKMRFTEAHTDLQETSETAHTSGFQSNNVKNSNIHQYCGGHFQLGKCHSRRQRVNCRPYEHHIPPYRQGCHR